LIGSSWILVLAVQTGSETKLGQSFGRPPIKTTALDTVLTRLISRWNFLLLGICVLFASWWNAQNGFLRELIINFLQLNGLNNLSTKLIGDLVRLSHSRQIANNPNLSVTANKYIPDALGTVDVMVMDKTGKNKRNKQKKANQINTYAQRQTNTYTYQPTHTIT
jgi:magnesium-transporting ATPase (P-type)